jgi:hypothetical protein
MIWSTMSRHWMPLASPLNPAIGLLMSAFPG